MNRIDASRAPRRSILQLVATISLATSLTLAGCSNTGRTAAVGSSSTPTKMYRIGIAQIVSHPSLDAIRQGFKDGMKDLGYVEGVNVRYDEQNPQGDQGALTSIANNFKGANLDLSVAITTPCAQSFAQAMPDKPIIFAGVTDPVSAKLVDNWEHPGGNLTGTSDYPPIDQQLQLIKDIKPATRTIGIVYSSSEVNSEVQTKLAKDAATKLGMNVKTVAVTNSSEVQQAAKSLSGVDAFYVGNDNTVVSGIEGLVQAAEQMKAVVITADPDSVGRGATAAYAVDQHKMGVNTAKMADRVLKGAKPGDIPVQKQTDLTLTVNPAAALRQGTPLSDAQVAKAAKVIR